MDQIEFTGKVINGTGKHSELFVPGRSEVPDCPIDWPEKLFPGSLNVRISKYPDEFAARRLPSFVATLDVASFASAWRVQRDICMAV